MERNLLTLLKSKFKNLVFERLPYENKNIILILVQSKIDGDMEVLCIYYDKPNKSINRKEVLRGEVSRLYRLRLSKWKKDIFTKKRRDFEPSGQSYAKLIDEYVEEEYPEYYMDWVCYFKSLKRPTPLSDYLASYSKVLPLFLKNPDIHSDLRRKLTNNPMGNCLILHPKVSPHRATLLIAIFLAQRGFIERKEIYKYWREAMPQKFKENYDLCNYVIDHFIYPLSSSGLMKYIQRASIIKKDTREVSNDVETPLRGDKPEYEKSYFDKYTFDKFSPWAEFDSDEEYFKQIGYSKVDQESPPEQFTLKRLAEQLGTTPRTLQKLQKSGVFKTKWNPPKIPKSCHGASKTIIPTAKTIKTIHKLKEKKKRKELTLRYAELKGIPLRSAQVWMTRQIRGKGKTLEEIERELKNEEDIL
jgi:hypothetical protein